MVFNVFMDEMEDSATGVEALQKPWIFRKEAKIYPRTLDLMENRQLKFQDVAHLCVAFAKAPPDLRVG